ncbi:MAG: methyl-accepting chemotaxis protein [Geitlerinemataceae cyanobacterium]
MIQSKNIGSRIGRWLSLGYAIPALVIATSSFAIWPQVRSLRGDTARYSQLVQNLERVDEIALNVQIAARTTRDYLLSSDPTALSAYRATETRLATLQAELDEILIDPEKREIFTALRQRIDSLDILNDELNALVESGNAAAAVNRWKADGGNELIGEVSALSSQFRARQIALVSELEGQQERSLNVLLGITAASSLILIATALALNATVVRLISVRLDRASSSIVSSSSQIAAAVAEQERTTAQQAISVNQTTATMDELSASARQVLQQAEAAANSAREALDESKTGSRAVELALENMILLKDKVGAIAQQILRLSEQTNQIGNISTLVSDLANQTNMLALNAAVEAVRAGEHGRGFSVVASEIRKLADRSKQSAERISHLVADIQNAINSTVMVTDEGTKTVESGVVRSQETSLAFSNVRGAADRVVLNNQQIALTIKQQVTAIQQVVEAMNALNGAAHASADGMGQVKTGTELLNDAAEDLATLV